MTIDQRTSVELLLRHAHPISKGWSMFREVQFRTQIVDYGFTKDDSFILVRTHLDSPYVSRTELQAAQQLQQACQDYCSALKVEVLLLYGKLLMEPHNMPKNVLVWSVAEIGENNKFESAFQ